MVSGHFCFNVSLLGIQLKFYMYVHYSLYNRSGYQFKYNVAIFISTSSH